MAEDKFWYRKEVGNPHKWSKFGKLQMDYLVSQGLKPYHFLLDVGCGPLRAGGHFIRYLNKRHYFGIDSNKALLEAGRDVELPTLKLEHKDPVLRCVEDFDLSWLGADVRFDYVMAQSLFTHLKPLQIRTCLESVAKRLDKKGRFYATFNPSKDGKQKQGAKHPRRNEQDWTYYSTDLFKKLASKSGLNCKYIGDWGHDLNKKNEQMMLVFTKSS